MNMWHFSTGETKFGMNITDIDTSDKVYDVVFCKQQARSCQEWTFYNKESAKIPKNPWELLVKLVIGKRVWSG